MTDLVQAKAFVTSDLTRSGLTPADFDIAPAPSPAAIVPFADTITIKGQFAGLPVYGYEICYPTPTHNGYISGFTVRRFADHPHGKYQGPTGITHAYWATDYPTWIKAKVKMIVEGEKKAVAVRKYLGAAAIGIRGCWGWSVNGRFMAEIAESIHAGDVVYILMDGDFVTHPSIRQAAGSLARQIKLLGAEPVMIQFPDYPNGGRMGADDWIMSQPSRARPTLQAAFDQLPQPDWRGLPEAPNYIARRLRLMVEPQPDPDKPPKIIRNEENTNAVLLDYFGEGALFTEQYKGPMFAPWEGEAIPYTDDTLDSELYRALERIFGTWSKDAFRSCRRNLISQTRRNLIAERLCAIQWDGVERMDNLFVVYFPGTDTPYSHTVSRGYCFGAVARLLYAGTKWDHVLVLEGKQRTGKSYGLSLLHYGSFVAIDMGMGKDNLARKATAAWCVCCDELDHMGKISRETFKAWVSETHEQWVPKYVEYAKETPRGFVISGTTNESVYLNDPTGAERFWPVKLHGKADHTAIIRDRDQIWAEAIHKFKAAGPDWWREFENDRTGAGDEQADREHDDILAHVISAHLKSHALPKLKIGNEFVTMHWLTNIMHNSGLPAARQTQPALLDACKRVGLSRRRARGGAVDAASLGAPSRPGSTVTVGHEQFHLGCVPDRLKVYMLDAGGSDDSEITE